jgi:hypothetical protein
MSLPKTRINFLIFSFLILLIVSLSVAPQTTTAVSAQVNTKELTNSSSVNEVLAVDQTAASNTSAPSIAWSKVYQDVPASGTVILQTKDGGYLLLCTKLGDSFFSLLKTDPIGTEMWHKTYPAEVSVYRQTVIETADGGYAVAATYQNSFLLLKIDESGNQQWNKTYSELGDCSARVIIQTKDGGYALSGTIINQSAPLGSNSVTWLVKTDEKGNSEWDKTLGLGLPKSIVQTTDGGYAIANDFYFTLVRLNSEGSLEWNSTYVSRDKNEVYTLVQTDDGGFALSGYIWQRIDGGNPYMGLVKTDASGNQQWVQYYGIGVADSMTKTADGGFVLADGNHLIKVQANGTMQWQTDIGGRSVIQTQDGGFALASLQSSNPLAEITKLNRDPSLPSPTTAPPTPNTSPSPTIPELTPWAFLALAVVVCFVVVVLKRRLRVTRN